MLVAYLHFAANPSDSAPAPIETWSLRAVKFLAKTSRLLMHVKVPVVIQGRGCLAAGTLQFLGFVQFRVFPAQFKKLRVGAFFHDTPVLDHDDSVCVPDG